MGQPSKIIFKICSNLFKMTTPYQQFLQLRPPYICMDHVTAQDITNYERWLIDLFCQNHSLTENPTLTSEQQQIIDNKLKQFQDLYLHLFDSHNSKK